MTAFITIGHDNFGSNILNTAEMIIGKQSNVLPIDFLIGESPEDVDYKINQAMNRLNTDEGVIFLVDLLGGTPFNRVMVKSVENNNVKVIAGVNMPLVIEILTTHFNQSDLDFMIEKIIDNSKEMIVFGNKIL